MKLKTNKGLTNGPGKKNTKLKKYKHDKLQFEECIKA